MRWQDQTAELREESKKRKLRKTIIIIGKVSKVDLGKGSLCFRFGDTNKGHQYFELVK